jgi:hypothetical protein
LGRTRHDESQEIAKPTGRKNGDAVIDTKARGLNCKRAAPTREYDGLGLPVMGDRRGTPLSVIGWWLSGRTSRQIIPAVRRGVFFSFKRANACRWGQARHKANARFANGMKLSGSLTGIATRVDNQDMVSAMHAAHYRLSARMRELECQFEVKAAELRQAFIDETNKILNGDAY